MKITLKSNNGKSVTIPIEDLIQKYWADENDKPNRIEMSATVEDETILAAMTICDEKEENYLSVDLGSLSMVRERLAPDEGETHRFDKPVRHGPKGGITTAYHRDRGDDLEIDSVVVDTPVVLKNAETLFLNILKEENITYGYLYNVADKLWYATDTVQDNRFFVLDENFIDAHT